MIWKTIVRHRAIAPRRRFVATALVYGLSLAVRFTSATGEQVEIPAQSLQRTKPVMSIMTGASPRLPYEDWAPKATQPIVIRAGWPLGSQAAARGCESSMPMPYVQDGLRQ
jgi:hypothetical protein